MKQKLRYQGFTGNITELFQPREAGLKLRPLPARFQPA